MADFHIRPATADDAPALGELGALLLRAHYGFDSARFMAPGANPERGYGGFLASQLSDSDAVVLVAERRGAVVGYVYAGLEPRSWKELREACGFIHDVAVLDAERRTGIATALVDAAMAWLRSRGAPRAMLWTAERNEGAHRLFNSMGFRRTMIEMTRELDA